MNNIILRGIINNIQYSHKIADTEFYKANILTNQDGRESINSIKFKKLSNNYSDGDYVELLGNVRSYSEKLDNGKNKVDIYTFTYFDIPENNDYINYAEIDGRICKIDKLRITKSGKENIHFILANNIMSNDNKEKLNSYIPCTAWGVLAKLIANLKVNTQLEIFGELRSREYKKILDNNEVEIRVAHEIVIKDFNIL